MPKSEPGATIAGMSQRALTLKQRRFVGAYVRTGNATVAAAAAYNVANANSAHAVAVETLRNPTVQCAVGELLDAEGISDRKLAEVHARFLALHDADDPQLKALGLKALDMAYKLKGAYASERHQIDAPRPLQIEPQQLERITRALREVAETEARARPRAGEDRPPRA